MISFGSDQSTDFIDHLTVRHGTTVSSIRQIFALPKVQYLSLRSYKEQEIPHPPLFFFFFAVPCTNGDVRLAGSTNPLQGRVEFCANGVWGTVCGDNWGVNDARVVCGQLGFSSLSEFASECNPIRGL